MPCPVSGDGFAPGNGLAAGCGRTGGVAPF